MANQKMNILIRAFKQAAVLKCAGIFGHAAMAYLCGYFIILAPRWSSEHERIIDAYLAVIDLLRLFR